MPKVPLSLFREMINDALIHHGYDQEEIKIISEVLLYAQLRGNNQNVVKLIGTYFKKRPSIGEIHPLCESPVSCLLDGGQQPGMVVMTKAMEIAKEKAKASGVSVVGTYNTNTSTGAIGFYADRLARDGLISFLFSGSWPMVAHHGAKTPLYGTNPIAIGIPTEKDPLVLDMSTSAISWFGVKEAHVKGESIPPNVAINKNGEMTTNPAEVLDGGSLLPFDNNYKGSSLALVVEVLTGPLVRSAFGGLGPKDSFGDFIIAFDPSTLASSLDIFKRQVSELIDQVHLSTPISPGGKILVPGERGNRKTKHVISQGYIEIDQSLLDGLRDTVNAGSLSKL